MLCFESTYGAVPDLHVEYVYYKFTSCESFPDKVFLISFLVKFMSLISSDQHENTAICLFMVFNGIKHS